MQPHTAVVLRDTGPVERHGKIENAGLQRV